MKERVRPNHKELIHFDVANQFYSQWELPSELIKRAQNNKDAGLVDLSARITCDRSGSTSVTWQTFFILTRHRTINPYF